MIFKYLYKINWQTPENLEYKLTVKSQDFGRVVGKGGTIAKAIRTVLYAGASKEGKRIHLDIESDTQEES